MHANAIPGRVKADLDEFEARVNARLARIEDGISRILVAAGLDPLGATPEGDGGSPAAPTPTTKATAP